MSKLRCPHCRKITAVEHVSGLRTEYTCEHCGKSFAGRLVLDCERPKVVCVVGETPAAS